MNTNIMSNLQEKNHVQLGEKGVEVFNINYDTVAPTISARQIHKNLGIEKRFSVWFETNSQGYVEGEDFTSVLSGTVVNNGAFRELIDYNISIDMAKHICLMSRTEKGKQCRQYLIDVEKAWNSPEQVYARALQMANNAIESLKNKNIFLEEKIAVQEQQISEMQPKVSYYDVVLNSSDLVAITVIAKDYGWSAKRLNEYLNDKGIQYKQGKKIWLLYQKYAQKGYTSTKTNTYLGNDGTYHTSVHTYWTQAGRLFIYDLLKSDGILPLIEID